MVSPERFERSTGCSQSICPTKLGHGEIFSPSPQDRIQRPILGDGIQRKFEGLRNLSLSNLLLCSPSLYLHYNSFQWKLSTKNKRLKGLEPSLKYDLEGRCSTVELQPHISPNITSSIFTYTTSTFRNSSRANTCLSLCFFC